MSYASDLRAAAEAEREAAITDSTRTPKTWKTKHRRRIALTTPDRLLPLLDRFEQLERVAEAAREWHDEGDCATCGADCACDLGNALNDQEAR